MAHITSPVMEKEQFNHFLLKVYGSFLLPWQPNQEADRQTFSYFELPLAKQHLYQISQTVSVVLEKMSFIYFFFFNSMLPC